MKLLGQNRPKDKATNVQLTLYITSRAQHSQLQGITLARRIRSYSWWLAIISQLTTHVLQLDFVMDEIAVIKQIAQIACIRQHF